MNIGDIHVILVISIVFFLLLWRNSVEYSLVGKEKDTSGGGSMQDFISKLSPDSGDWQSS